MVEVQNSEENQKNGVVNVLYNIGMCAPEKNHPELMRHMHLVNDSLPYRLSASHYCYDDERMRGAIALLQLVVGRNTRLRFRAHFGTLLIRKTV